MSDIAIVKTGGKQYKVAVGDIISVEKINTQDKKVEFNDLLAGKTVTAEIVNQGKAKKVDILKFHHKNRYQRLKGHRQQFTQIKIEAIK